MILPRLIARAACTAIVAASFPSTVLAAERVILDNVTIVDTRTGELTPKRAVVVEGDKIVRIVAASTVKPVPGDRRIDADDKFLVPGFNDMHAHPLNPGDTANQLRMMLSMGITGFRQMSGSPDLLAKRRAGTLISPEAPTLLATSGALLIGPNAATPEIAVAEVRRQQAEGVDFIKAINLPPAVLFAVHAEAKAEGLTVTGHLSPLVDPREAADHGMDGIEHAGPGVGLLLGCSSREAELRDVLQRGTSSPPAGSPGSAAGAAPQSAAGASPSGAPVGPPIANPEAFRSVNAVLATGPVLDSHDPAKCRSLATLLATRHVWQTPTLIRLRTMEFGDDPAYLNDPNLRYVSPADRAVWREAAKQFGKTMTGPARAELDRLFAAQRALVKLFYDNHVPMMAGDDAGGSGWVVPGYGLHNEFDLLAEAGLPPLAILQMATLNPAQFLHREATMGTVEQGKTADLVLLDANPIVSAANLHGIRGLLHNGRYYSAADLAALRDQTEGAQREVAGRRAGK